MKGIDTPELKDLNLNKQASIPIGLLKGLADHKKITIENQINPSWSIQADPQHFDIIIRTILLNSIKFTHEQGSINLYSNIENDQVAICIEDNRVGMNPGQINRLFQ